MATRSTRPDQPPLVVIVGPTASGKTALALELAKRYDGAIICADSRTVYKGMDIGTAKPSAEEQAAIPHYGLDAVEPGEPFSAYDFQQLAGRVTADIAAAGKLPIMVGGTGLYIDAVLYDFQFRKSADPNQRQKLQELSVDELQRQVVAAGYPLPENSQNRRHLTRLLESGQAPQQGRRLRPNTLVLGLRPDADQLRERVTNRVDAMIEAGLAHEVKGLIECFGSVEALRAPGYKAFAGYLEGQISLDEAKQQFVRDDLRLAKRQRTWFKRNADIHWLDNRDVLTEAVALITTFLVK